MGLFGRKKDFWDEVDREAVKNPDMKPYRKHRRPVSEIFRMWWKMAGGIRQRVRRLRQ